MHIKGDFLIAGVGSELPACHQAWKEFDRIGIEIARKGREIYPEKFIDCGIAPENYLDKIIKQLWNVKCEMLNVKPEMSNITHKTLNKKTGEVKTLIIVDAVYYEGNEKVKIFLPEDLSIQGISTHSLSLDFIAKYLRNYGIQTVIVGIKPGKGIKESQERVLSALLELIKNNGVRKNFS